MQINLNDFDKLKIGEKIIIADSVFIIHDFKLYYTDMNKYSNQELVRTMTLEIEAFDEHKMYEKIKIILELDENHKIFGG